MSKEVSWDLYGILLRDHDLPELPDSPYSPSLVKLSLQAHSLIVIPPTFFERMPMLEVLDLSNTSIVSLPTSISSLSSLQEFFLRDCSNLIELPTDIGMLTKLKLFDIKGTELMFIPKEIGELKDLEVFRVSLSQNAKCYIKAQGVIETVIPRKMISKLKKLKELCISVPPEAEWWEEEVKYFQNELCDLENLQTLGWYLPTNEVLQRFLLLERNHVPLFANLSNLMLTIGHHEHLISCLPLGLGKKFEEFKKCLKWINAEGSTDDVTKIMACVEALFLSRHWTLEKLSTFNVSELKYCLLTECNDMQTLVEAHEDEETKIKNGEKVGLELLQYLSIYCMKKLQSIWRGPIGKDSLSKLTILALHTCPQLTSIFSPTIAQNLSCLIELVVEDCPKVRSLISNESHIDIHGPIFPTLDRIFLLDLPELVNIFGGLIILEKLSTLLIYNCLKLRDLSLKGLPHIKKIEAETEWWEDLEFPNKPLLKNFFVPLKERRDLIDQLFEATNSLQHFHDAISHEHDEKKSSEASMEKGKGINKAPDKASGTNLFYSFREWARLALSRQETEDDESNGWSRFKVSYIASETDLFYSFREMVSVVGSRQETEDNKSYDWSHSDAPDTKTGTGIFYSFEEVDRFTLSRQESGLAKMISLDKIDSFGTRVVELENTADKNVEEKMEEVMRAGEDNAQMMSIMDLVRCWLELISITEKTIIKKMGIEPSSFRVLKWIVILMVQKYVAGILKNMYIK